jgi:hypothetical protein
MLQVSPTLCKLLSAHYAFHPPTHPFQVTFRVLCPKFLLRVITKQLLKHTPCKQITTKTLTKPFHNNHPPKHHTHSHPYSYWHTHFQYYSAALIICTLMYVRCYIYVTACLLLCTLLLAVTVKNCSLPSAVNWCVLSNCHNTRQQFTWTAVTICC